MHLLKQFAAVAAVALVGGQAVTAAAGNEWAVLVLGVITAAVTLIVYAWVVRRTELRAPAEVARPGAAPRIFRGVLIGSGMFATVILNIALLGGYQVTGFGSVTGTLAIFGFMAAAVVTEELIFRGILFRGVEERLGTWVAVLLSGIGFGLMHLFNPDASLWGAIAIAIEAGFMLAACYAATRNLWVPIGLHFGWNFAAAGIFGVVVSGNGESKGLLEATMPGPALLTGGDFGPEGSLYTVAAGVALTVAFMVLAHRRGHIVPRHRARQASATVSR